MADKTVITEIRFETSGADTVTGESTTLLDLLNQLEQKAQAVGQSFAGMSSGGLSELTSQLDTATSSLDTLASSGTTAASSLQSITGGDAAAGLSDLDAAAQGASSNLDSLGAAGGNATASLQGISGGDAAAGLTDVGSAAQTLGGDLDTASTSAGSLSSALQSGDFSALGPDIDSAAGSLSTLATDAGTAETAISSLSGASGLSDIAPEAQAAASGLGDLSTSATEAETSLSGESNAAAEAGHENEAGGEAAGHHAQEQAGLGAAVGTATGFLSEQVGITGEVAASGKEAFNAISELASGEGEAGASADVAAAAVLAMGAAIVSVSAESFIELTDSVHELGEKTGLSTDLIQGLGYAEETIGNNASDADGALAKLSRSLGQMSDSLSSGAPVSKTFAAGLEAIGVSAQDLNLMTPDEQVRTIIEHFSQLPESANKATIAFDLMGKQGQNSIGLFSQGTAAIDAGTAKVNEFGASVHDAWPKVQQFHTTMADLKTVEQGLAVTVGTEVVPALATMIADFVQGAKDAQDFITKLDELVQWGNTHDGSNSPGKGLGDDLRSAFNNGVQREASLTSAAVADVNASLEKAFPPLLAAEKGWGLLNAQQERNAAIARQQAAERAATPGSTNPNLTDDRQTAADADAVAASFRGQALAVGEANNALHLTAGSLNEAAAAERNLLDAVASQSSAETAVDNLRHSVDSARKSYEDALTAQNNFLNRPTDQQQSQQAALDVAKAELAGYQLVKPGQEGYAEAQKQIATLTKQTIPAITEQKAAVDTQATAFKDIYGLWERGQISGEQFNQMYADLAKSTHGATESTIQQKSAVDATNAAGANLVSTIHEQNQAFEDAKHNNDTYSAGTDAASQHTLDLLAAAQSLSDVLDPLGGHFVNAGQDASTASGDISSIGQSASTVGGVLDESGTRVEGWGSDVVHSGETAGTGMTTASGNISTALTDTGGHLDTSSNHFLSWHKSSSQAATETATDTQTASGDIGTSLQATGSALDTSQSNFSDWQRGGSTAVDNLATSVRLGLEQLDSAASAESVAIGVDIAAGMAAGIAAGSGAVAAAAAGAVDNAVAAAKAAGQISSPSRRTWQEIGVPLMDGITGAVLDETSGLAAAISNSVQGAIATGASELVNAPGELANAPGELVSGSGGFGAGVGGKPSTALADALTKHADSTAKHTDALTKHSAAIGTGSATSAPAALDLLSAAAQKAATALDALAAHVGGSGGAGGSGSATAALSSATSGDKGKGAQASSKTGDSTQALSELIGIPSPQEMVRLGSTMVDSIAQGAQEESDTLSAAITSIFQGGVVAPFVSDATTLGEAAVSGLAAGWDAGSPQLSELAASSGDAVAAAFSTHAGFGGELASAATATGWQAGSAALSELAGTSGDEAGKKWSDAFSQQSNAAVQSAQSAAPSSGGGGGGGSGGGGGGASGLPAGGGDGSGGGNSGSQPNGGTGFIKYSDAAGLMSGTHLSEQDTANLALTMGAALDRLQPIINVGVHIGETAVEAIWARAATNVMTTRVQSTGGV